MNSTITTMLATAVVIGITVWLTLTLSDVASDTAGTATVKGYELSARFDNVGHLKAGDRVTAAGVEVGQVVDITYDFDNYEAVVKMRIAHRYDRFPLDTSASILTTGLVGAQYIGLQPGAEERSLVEGDRLDITSSALILEQIVGQLLYNMTQDESSPTTLADPAVDSPGF